MNIPDADEFVCKVFDDNYFPHMMQKTSSS